MCDRDCPMRGENCHAKCKIHLIGVIMRELDARKRQKAADLEMFIASESRVIRTRAKKYQKKW